jgi:hypothetical protein
VSIATHKGNHHFHRGINTNLFATTVSTDATHIFGCHNTEISQRINTLVAIKPTVATKHVVLPEIFVL